MMELTNKDVESVSGGIFPAIAVIGAAAFVVGLTAGIAAAAAAKAD